MKVLFFRRLSKADTSSSLIVPEERGEGKTLAFLSAGISPALQYLHHVVPWSFFEFPGDSLSFLEFLRVPRKSSEFLGVPQSSFDFLRVSLISMESSRSPYYFFLNVFCQLKSTFCLSIEFLLLLYLNSL